MKKFTVMIIAVLAMIISSLALAAPAANAAADTQSKQSKSSKCDKAPGSFVAPNGLVVLNTKTCFDVKILKKMGCDTEAGKVEQPAPPRDPKSKCKGKFKVKFKLKYKTPECPVGWIGGSLKLSLNIKQEASALGLSKSIASGRVDTWARTKIKLLDKFKGKVTNDCVLIPPPPPETCPQGTTWEDTNRNGKVDDGECKTPPVENKKPTGEIVQWPAHLEPGEYYKVKVVGSDPEDSGSVELIYTVEGGAHIVTGDANHPTICDVEGSNKVCTFWMQANQSVGVEYEVNLRVRDGEGNFFDAPSKSGTVQALPV